jgi:hypothetical protein
MVKKIDFGNFYGIYQAVPIFSHIGRLVSLLYIETLKKCCEILEAMQAKIRQSSS